MKFIANRASWMRAISGLALAAGLCHPASAVVTFSVDLNVDEDGIQNTRDIAPGEAFTVALRVNAPEDDDLSGFDTNIRFESDFLSFGQNFPGTDDPTQFTVPNGFLTSVGTPIEDASDLSQFVNEGGQQVDAQQRSDRLLAGSPFNTTGAVRDISVSNLSTLFGGSTEISDLEFLQFNLVADPNVPVGDTSIEFFFLGPESVPNTNLGNAPFTVNNATLSVVAAVPEPASMLALTAIGGVAVWRRRRRA